MRCKLFAPPVLRVILGCMPSTRAERSGALTETEMLVLLAVYSVELALASFTALLRERDAPRSCLCIACNDMCTTGCAGTLVCSGARN